MQLFLDAMLFRIGDAGDLWDQGTLVKAADAATMVAKRSAQPSAVTGHEDTVAAPRMSEASLKPAPTFSSQEKPSVKIKGPDVSSPGHQLAAARAIQGHARHYYLYHTLNNDPARADQSLKKYHQASSTIQHLEGQGVQDTEQHHRDWILHYKANPHLYKNSSVPSSSRQQFHALHAGNWGEEIDASKSLSIDDLFVKSLHGKQYKIEMVVSPQAAEQLKPLLEELKKLGDWGCSRGLKIEDWGHERGERNLFGFDGDGSSKIHSLTVAETTEKSQESTMIRPDMIGPRRLAPASQPTGSKLFVFTEEDPRRVLKSQVLPGVTEGQINGVMPSTPSTQPQLYIEIKKSSDDLKKDYGYGGKEEVEELLKQKPTGVPHLGVDRAEAKLDTEHRKKRLSQPLMVSR